MKKLLLLIMCLVFAVCTTSAMAQVTSSIEIQVTSGTSKMQSAYTGTETGQTTYSTTSASTTGSSYYNGTAAFGGYSPGLTHNQTLTGNGEVSLNQQTGISTKVQYAGSQGLPSPFAHTPVFNGSNASVGVSVQFKTGGIAQTGLDANGGVRFNAAVETAPGGMATYQVNAGYNEAITRAGMPPILVSNYQMTGEGTGNVQFKFQYQTKKVDQFSIP